MSIARLKRRMIYMVWCCRDVAALYMRFLEDRCKAPETISMCQGDEAHCHSRMLLSMAWHSIARYNVA